MSHRNAHYWLWFLLFGVIAGLLYYHANNKLSSESIWLLVSGFLGIIVAMNWLNEGKFARPYDVIIGAIFSIVGILGILLNFGVFKLTSLPSSLYANNSLIGLDLGVSHHLFILCLVSIPLTMASNHPSNPRKYEGKSSTTSSPSSLREGAASSCALANSSRT